METVQQFKERLRNELNIPVERQRLIFQGKVLQDETKLADSNIQNKTVHFVERAEPPPSQNTNNGSSGVASDINTNQLTLDEINETTSVFINSFPGAVNLNTNNVQDLVQNLLNDLGDIGRQARVNTSIASDGQGVDIQIDFGSVSQYLQQHELRERFRSIGRMLSRLRLRLNRLEQLVESNFRLPTSTAGNTGQQNQTGDVDSSASSSATFEDIINEMDADDLQASTLQTIVQSTTVPNESSAPVTNHTARDLADLMHSIDSEQRRLNKYFQEYMRTISHNESFGDDLAGRRRFYSLYNESLHLISHVYHNVTDFSINLEQPLETRDVHLGEPTSLAPSTVTTARIMGPVSLSGAAQMGFHPRMAQGVVPFHPAPMVLRPLVPGMTLNNTEQSSTASSTSATSSSMSNMQPMAFNLGVPWTFLEMVPAGITLNQVSAQIVADVQASDGASSVPAGIQNLSGLPVDLSSLPPNATVIMGQRPANANGQPGSIQMNEGPFDANFAASIAQRVQEHFAQLSRPTGAVDVASGPTNVSFSTQLPSNNNNLSSYLPVGISARNPHMPIHARFVMPNGIVNMNPQDEHFVLDDRSFRSRSADASPSTSSSSSISQPPTDDPSHPATMFAMASGHDHPLQGRLMIPGQRTTILQSVDRSLPCSSRYFTHMIRSRTAGNEVFGHERGHHVFTRRGRHRHPAGQGAFIHQHHPQQHSQFSSDTPNDFIMSSGGMPPSGVPLFSPNNGQSFMTAHSFEIPMVISASTDISQQSQPQPSPQEQSSAASSSPDNQQTPVQPTNNQQNAEAQQVQNTILSQVLSQILPGVLRSGTGRIRLNVGQMNANEVPTPILVTNNANSIPAVNTTAHESSTSIPASETNANPSAAMNVTQNPMGLDFTGVARTIGSIVQELTLTGATFDSLNPTDRSSIATPLTSSTTSVSSTTPTNTSSSTTTITLSREDTNTGQMLIELLRLLGSGPENPELNNLTIGAFMQRFGEDFDSGNSNETCLIRELFSVMTAQMRFSDVWDLILGNPIVDSRFNQARRSATSYLQNNVLHGRPITPMTIDELCEKLYQPFIQETSLNELRLKPNINLENVMKRFFMHHGRLILNTIFHDDDNVWFDHFRQQLISARNEYLSLTSHCFVDGEPAAIEYLLNRNRTIFRTTNPIILTWSETYLRRALTHAFSGIRSSPSNISSYLTESAISSATNNGGMYTMSTRVNSSPQTSTIVNKTDNGRQQQLTTRTGQENNTWQASLPEEWVPIVVRDVVTQNHTHPQSPLSDAYKDGIPTKRRRVYIREDLTSTNLLNNILIRASHSSNTHSQLPDSDSIRHMASSPELLQTFDQELKRLLELRLKNDRDYEKVHLHMPNTKRYLEE
ncbi:unnamed protein product [Didymodactylos carnosus]|uniref:BCL2-associated athanogene 6 n=1 Tax=Didymodactylos carnosus TaxID=1234261 RepID=A0A8S2DKV1_9BILA|nr:unnamed protein product [Didymodactylos carnosus]CAF3752215.1 unnamed protein product [Didymodactylos carnosus]